MLFRGLKGNKRKRTQWGNNNYILKMVYIRPVVHKTKCVSICHVRLRKSWSNNPSVWLKAPHHDLRSGQSRTSLCSCYVPERGGCICCYKGRWLVDNNFMSIYLSHNSAWMTLKTRKCSKLRGNLQETPCLAHLKMEIIELYRATKLLMQP